ncbi:thioredoxin, partial [Aspergillus ellipticus CBS 707.79]
WCYIGFRRLSRAIALHRNTYPTDTFTLNWHAFYLNPTSPTFPGLDKTEFYQTKFGRDRAAAIFERLTAVGRTEGVQFSFGGRSGRTRDSHRVVWLAGQREKELEEGKKGAAAVQEPAEEGVIGGLQTRVVERLFRAYFEEEKNITDPEVLVQAAVGAGLEREAVEKLLDSEEGGDEVDLEAERARRQLVTGVPYFMIQGQYAVEGADEPETFLEVFEQVKKVA